MSSSETAQQEYAEVYADLVATAEACGIFEETLKKNGLTVPTNDFLARYVCTTTALLRAGMNEGGVIQLGPSLTTSPQDTPHRSVLLVPKTIPYGTIPDIADYTPHSLLGMRVTTSFARVQTERDMIIPVDLANSLKIVDTREGPDRRREIILGPSRHEHIYRQEPVDLAFPAGVGCIHVRYDQSEETEGLCLRRVIVDFDRIKGTRAYRVEDRDLLEIDPQTPDTFTFQYNGSHGIRLRYPWGHCVQLNPTVRSCGPLQQLQPVIIGQDIYYPIQSNDWQENLFVDCVQTDDLFRLAYACSGRFSSQGIVVSIPRHTTLPPSHTIPHEQFTVNRNVARFDHKTLEDLYRWLDMFHQCIPITLMSIPQQDFTLAFVLQYKS